MATSYQGKDQTFNDVLKVTVSTYQNWNNASNQNGQYIHAEVKLTNVGQVPLKNTQATIDPDDNGKFWDAVLVDHYGNVISANKQTFTFGDLAPGQAQSQTFWYSIRPAVSGVTPQENFIITLNVIPVFSIDYSGYGYGSNTTEVHTK